MYGSVEPCDNIFVTGLLQSCQITLSYKTVIVEILFIETNEISGMGVASIGSQGDNFYISLKVFVFFLKWSNQLKL